MNPASDIIVALKNIFERNSCILSPIFRSDGTANAAGDSLEYFVKDMFSPGNRAAQHSSQTAKEIEYKKYLSWTGNSSNFPDFIVRGGVGVEPKKIKSSLTPNLALNSSYPKDYIHPDTQNLPSENLIDEGPWERKEIIYVIGSLPDKSPVKDKLKYIWFAYGNTYIANEVVYKSVIKDIREALDTLRGNLMTGSKELGRVYGIDPLGATNLRVRGMYELQHPGHVFKDLVENAHFEFPDGCTQVYAIILKSDYDNLANSVDLSDENHDLSRFIESGRLKTFKVEVPNPNLPDSAMQAILFIGYTD